MSCGARERGRVNTRESGARIHFGARCAVWSAVFFFLVQPKALGAEHAATSELCSSRPPNIVLFLVDDLGQQDVSVSMLKTPSALNARFRTPNLEKLAARGVRFSDAYAAAPVCTPSRTAILTGQSPARTHITYWTLEKDTDQSSRHPRLDPPKWAVNGLAPAATHLAELLRSAGYRTIHAGKAHFGARGTPGADPCNLGFDVNIAGHAAGAPGSFLGTHWFRDAARKRAERGLPVDPASAPVSVWDVPGLSAWHGQTVWLDDVIAREACDAITASVRDARPFYLSFAPYGVHTPIMADDRFARAYPDLDPIERAYASMVAAVDDALGAIVARCTQLGVAENTIIVFTSDNGGLSAHARGTAPDGTQAHRHNAPLRSGKGSAYEGGTRVPLVIAGPRIPHRAEPLSMPVVGTDLYPTILAWAGVAPPSGHVLDGIDLAPCWSADGSIAERTILFHQPHAWGPQGPGIEPFTAIRRGNWKLVWFHDRIDRALRIELFHLATDLGETCNLARTEPARVAELVQILRTELAARGGQLSLERSSGKLVVIPPSRPTD